MSSFLTILMKHRLIVILLALLRPIKERGIFRAVEALMHRFTSILEKNLGWGSGQNAIMCSPYVAVNIFLGVAGEEI